MISIELKRTDGNFISINLPENSKELTLSQKLDFDFAQIGLISYLKKYEDNLFSNRAGYILQLAKGLSEFLELDLSVILNLDGINLLEISQQDFLEHLELFSAKLKGVNKAQLESNLLILWNYIANVCQSEDVSLADQVEYKDQVYKLPTVQKHPVTGKPIHESTSVQQAVEIIQAKNNYQKWLDSQTEGKEDLPTKKNMLFSMILSEIVLLLEPEMPTDEDGFMIWLNNRILHFQDIDWQTAYSVQVWFNNYMEELRSYPENKYFFESSFIPGSKEERDALHKSEWKGKQIYKNVGIKGIYPVLLELNPFQKEGKNKFVSMLQEKFSNAVKIISLHNSKG